MTREKNHPTRPTLDQAVDVAEQHHHAGRLVDAERMYRQVLLVQPRNRRVLHDLGVLALQRGRPEAALVLFESVLAMFPDAAATLNAAGNALRQLGRAAQARAKLERAVAVQPDDAVAHNSLGNLLRDQGELIASEQMCRRAVELAPDYAEAHNNLGNALLDAGQTAAAATCFRRAFALQPSPTLYSNLLYCLSHDETVEAQASFEAHRYYGAMVEPPLLGERAPHQNSRQRNKRLRVGFVSGDLRRHAVSHFIEPTWRCLDRTQVEVLVYSNLAVEDQVTARLRACADAWCPVSGMNDSQLAQRMRQDGVDILIDLSGHTAGNRLPVFARKPAPVQAGWIGYPETTGLTTMDYCLVDPHSSPPGLVDSLYVEKLVRLPTGSAFLPPEDAPPTSDLPALSQGCFTFGSFNRLNKLNARAIALWSRALRAVPDSRMLLGNVSDAALQRSIRERFAAHGIDAERLRFHPRVALNDYLRLHHEVDVILDTFPYTGGTTTKLALWMGVPVLTLAGQRRAERASTANLVRVGLSDWSVDSADAFVARAVQAAQELPALAELRAGLRERMRSSPMLQSDTVTRCFEQALRTMWRRWCDDLPPQAFSVELPPSA